MTEQNRMAILFEFLFIKYEMHSRIEDPRKSLIFSFWFLFIEKLQTKISILFRRKKEIVGLRMYEESLFTVTIVHTLGKKHLMCAYVCAFQCDSCCCCYSRSFYVSILFFSCRLRCVRLAQIQTESHTHTHGCRT